MRNVSNDSTRFLFREDTTMMAKDGTFTESIASRLHSVGSIGIRRAVIPPKMRIGITKLAG